MAIKITENGVVNYENSPDVNRKLFPNLNICGKEINELADEIDGKAPLIVNTASGSIASFDNGADDMPLKSCIVSFDPIQEGEGDPSPENVRPISGRTGLTVYHSGNDTSDPTTISVNWETEAGTVYGGSLDVVSGKLTVDRGYSKLSDLTSWGTDSNLNSGTMRAVISNVLKPGTNVVTTAIMDCRKAVAYGPLQPTWTTSFAITYDGKVVVPMNRQITVAEFLSEYGNHEICYPLATPIEIQLTGQEVRTLLGVNNIWSDAGNVSVESPADTKTYIDELSIKTVEVSGQSPTITAEKNTRYICGEVTSLTFTPCETGICDVRFTAASISTVLTLPETVKLPDWFDPTLLEANTTYEINIVDGIYGVVMSWA